MRRLVANLDAEARWAGRSPTLRRPVRAALAAWGTLMRVFAKPGDRLWTLAPVDPARLPTTDGLPRPTLEEGTGPFPTAASTLPWARARPWVDDETAAIAARVADRSFGVDLARALGVAPDGSRWVEDVETLRRHVRELGSTWPDGWLVKAPWSTAGRERHVGRGPDDADAPAVRGLLRRHGRLLVEPWHQRTDDLGVVFEVADGETPPLDVTIHRLLTDDRGTFRGIEIGGRVASNEDRSALEGTARVVAAALADAGFEGPAGVDAYRHRAPSGRNELRTLVEINPRHTFGTLARALVRRLAPEVEHDAERRARLRLGRDEEWRAAPAGSMLLVAPDDAGLGAAWLEWRDAPKR